MIIVNSWAMEERRRLTLVCRWRAASEKCRQGGRTGLIRVAYLAETCGRCIMDRADPVLTRRGEWHACQLLAGRIDGLKGGPVRVVVEALLGQRATGDVAACDEGKYPGEDSNL
jgi:hypothetical protein